MSQIKLGELAPMFDLVDDMNNIITSNNVSSNFTILYFYPKDDTPGCTQEAQDFRDLKLEFEKLGAKIIGVSKDNINSHQKFKAKYKLNFCLAADDTGKILNDFEVLQEKSMFGKKYLGVARATFLLDKNNILLYIWDNVKVKGHAQEVLDRLKQIVNQGV